MIAATRFVFAFSLGAFLLASCAHREPEPQVVDTTPLNRRLDQFAAVQNSLKYEELRSFFTKDARVQSPITPRQVSVDAYLKALAVEPYGIVFSNTELVYAFTDRAVTRSDVVAGAPGKFNLKERVTVDWRLEDGFWRIARILFPDWPSILGTYRRSGQRGEGSIELRLMPGGRYVIYTAENFSTPQYRGQYTVDGNRITMSDTASDDPKKFQPASGIYVLTPGSTGMNFQKISDDNTWRTDRFDGLWIVAR